MTARGGCQTRAVTEPQRDGGICEANDGEVFKTATFKPLSRARKERARHTPRYDAGQVAFGAKCLRAFRGAALTCHRHVIHSRAPASRPLDAIKGSLSGGQSRPPLQLSPVSLCRKEILKKFLRDCNLDILWYTVRE